MEVRRNRKGLYVRKTILHFCLILYSNVKSFTFCKYMCELFLSHILLSLSSRRAWIEIVHAAEFHSGFDVALLTEGVD